MYLTNNCHPGLSLNRDLQLCRASGPTAPSISSRTPPAPPHTLTRCPRLYRRSCHTRPLHHFFERRCDRLDSGVRGGEWRVTCSLCHVSLVLFLLRLIQPQLARALRLAFSRVLGALKVGVVWCVGGRASAARIRAAAKRATGLCLELFGEFALRASPATAMRITSLGDRLLEFVASVLSMVGHRDPPGSRSARQTACRVPGVSRGARSLDRPRPRVAPE
jgi:hypothetical protein